MRSFVNAHLRGLRGIRKHVANNPGIGDALPSLPGQATSKQRPDRFRNVGRQRRPVRLACDDRVERGGAVRAAERGLRRQHLEEDAPERPEIASFVEGTALHLLGAHVCGRAQHRTCIGHRRIDRRWRRWGIAVRFGIRYHCWREDRFRQAEIEKLDGALLRHLDVGWFEIAMDDPALVRDLQRLCDLLRNRQRLVQGNRTALEPIRQRRTLDQLQHERAHASEIFEAVDRGNRRVIERCEHLRFPAEPTEKVRIVGQGVGQHLQRDVPLQPGIAGAVDLTHSARADERVDPVVADMRANRQPCIDVEQPAHHLQDRRVDKHRRGLVRQQRVHFAPELLVFSTRVREKRLAGLGSRSRAASWTSVTSCQRSGVMAVQASVRESLRQIIGPTLASSSPHHPPRGCPSGAEGRCRPCA